MECEGCRQGLFYYDENDMIVLTLVQTVDGGVFMAFLLEFVISAQYTIGYY